MREQEARLAEWFATHHGVIDRRNARTSGVTDQQMALLIRCGTWIRIYRGVYHLAAVPLTPIVRLQAGVLLGGEGTVVSHESAAWLLGLRQTAPDQPTVTVPRGRMVRVAGVKAVRSRHPASGYRQRGLVCTDVPRTILDCAGGSTDGEVDDLIDVALAKRFTTVESIARAASSPTLRQHPGRARLRRRLESRGFTGSPSPSVLESRMARVFKRFKLPRPKAQVTWGPNGKFRLDYAYSTVRLVVEVDGQSEHGRIEQQRYDRRRDDELRAAGWTVVHYDWWEVTFEPERVAAEIAARYQRLDVTAKGA